MSGGYSQPQARYWQQNADALADLFTKYQRDAMATALVTEKSKDLLIRSCGLAGEFGEMQAAQKFEEWRGEMADVAWYAASIAQVLGFSIGDRDFVALIGTTERAKNLYFDDPNECDRPAMSGWQGVAYVCEWAKKVAGHGRDKPIEPLKEALAHVLYVAITDCQWWVGCLEALARVGEDLAANVAKLRKRHADAGPGGFDPNYGKPAQVSGRPAELAVGESKCRICGHVGFHTCNDSH